MVLRRLQLLAPLGTVAADRARAKRPGSIFFSSPEPLRCAGAASAVAMLPRRCRPQRRRCYEAPPKSRDAQVPPPAAASQVCAARFLRCAGAAFSGDDATAPVPLLAAAALQRAAQTPRCAGAAFQRASARRSIPAVRKCRLQPRRCCYAAHKTPAMRSCRCHAPSTAAMLLHAGAAPSGGDTTKSRPNPATRRCHLQRQRRKCAPPYSCDAQVQPSAAVMLLRRCRSQRRRRDNAPPKPCDAQVPPFSGGVASACR